MVDVTNNAGTLSDYIISFANSAKTAQEIMSQGQDSMSIKEFRFKVNIEAESSFENSTDVSLKFWTTSVKNKMTITESQKQAIEVECTLAPTWSIEGQ